MAFERDLYTVAADGRDADDFERWIKREYEDPGHAALLKAVGRKNLGPEDWRHLALFAVCQDLRTPQHYMEFMDFMKREGPSLLESIAKGVEGLLTNPSETRASQPRSEGPFDDALRISLRRDSQAEEGNVQLGLHLLTGRDMWIREQMHLLDTVSEVAISHSWCIAEAAKGFEWFTSDHPLVRLQYYGDGDFDVSGGWGKSGTNILMPLSRRYLLLCQVGSEGPTRMRLTKENTLIIRRAIARRAHRSVFALRPVQDMAAMRPRTVDLEAYKSERNQWAVWHQQQSEAEQTHCSLPRSLQEAMAEDNFSDEAHE